MATQGIAFQDYYQPAWGASTIKNLILITAEAFTKEVIDPERTPTLYRMATQGIAFQDYYQPAWGASTISGEFSNLTGLVPTNGGSCMKEVRQQNLFLTMGHQLQRQGYYSTAYHNHLKDFYDRDKTHTLLGYDQYLALYGGLDVTPTWPESDREMMDLTIPQYIDHQPFSIYYMTVSGHSMYSLKENAMSRKHYDKVAQMDMMDLTIPQYIDHQPFSIYYMTVSGHSMYSLKENAMSRKHYDKVAQMDHSEKVKCYYACQLELEEAMTALLTQLEQAGELEEAMTALLTQLEQAGIADDTVVVLATDHYPYGLEYSSTWGNHADYLSELYGVALLTQLEQAGIADDTVVVLATDHYPYGLEYSSTWGNHADYLSELYGVEQWDKEIRDHNALIIWSGCLEGKNIQVEGPVYSLDILPTLSNLFGLPYDSRLLVGRDVFSQQPPLVLEGKNIQVEGPVYSLDILPTLSNLFGLPYDSRLLVGRDVFSQQPPLVLWPDFSWKTDKGFYAGFQLENGQGLLRCAHRQIHPRPWGDGG